MNRVILPADMLHKRLEVIRTLLGPGWLGMSWCDWHDSGIRSADTGRESWRNAEAAYNRLVSWLLPGLCQLLSPRVSVESSSVSSCENMGPLDVPVAAMHILRGGLIVRPASVETTCRISPYNLLHAIVPALAYLYCLHDHRAASGPDGDRARCAVALAAVPGAGKSVLANVLQAFSCLLKTFPQIQAISMDGWHYPNSYLRDHDITDESGNRVKLATRKGGPQSFDVKALTSMIDRLVHQPDAMDIPIYDRTIHEPVPASCQVEAPIVLIEGNYLLVEAEPWGQVGGLIDGGIWLDVPLELARRSISGRDKALGRSDEQAEAKWRGNDWPNSLAALAGRYNADTLVYTNDARQQQFVHRIQPGA